MKISHGMVLAAGLGRRMRPITDRMPKPMVKVAKRTLLDRALDHLEEVGVTKAVVNTHYLAEQIHQHLKGRKSPEVTISFEDVLLETGGGIKNALPHLGNAPFYAVNADVMWLNGPLSALDRLATEWDDGRMDGLLLLHSTVEAYGYEGMGDFVIDPDGRLERRPELEVSPFLFTGVQILHPRLFDGAPDGAYSLNRLYDKAIEAGRLYGVVHDGEWFHIGTPSGLDEVEAYMQERFPGAKRR